MELLFYKTVDSSNTINKTLTDPLTVNINFKQGTDIVNPELILKGDFKGFNYAEIVELGRKYLINSIEQINLNMVKISLICDVIETYKDIILNSEASYNRSLKDGDLYDANIAVSTVKNVRIVESPVNVKAAQNTIILSTVGVISWRAD